MKLYTFTEDDEVNANAIIVQVRAENHDQAVAQAQTMRLATPITSSTSFYSEVCND